MPKVYLQEKDITQLVTTITWGGDSQQAARKLEIGIVVSPTDYYLPKINLALGSMLKLLDDDKSELFKGYVFSKEKSNSGSEMPVTCYDALIYLVKSKGTYNFKNITPEQITSKVAQEFNIPTGNIASTGIPVSYIADGLTLYEVIMQGYSEVSKKNGKSYMLQMVEGKLEIVEKGKLVADYMLSEDTNIIDGSYTESIEEMVNRVKIYDENGNQLGQVENADWIKSYGILQDEYRQEEGKDFYSEAKNMLKGVSRTSSITAIGNISCITGRAVFIKEPYSGLVGYFYIESDTHTWQDGVHTMDLTLNLQDIIDSNKAKQLIKAGGYKK